MLSKLMCYVCVHSATVSGVVRLIYGQMPARNASHEVCPEVYPEIARLREPPVSRRQPVKRCKENTSKNRKEHRE